MKQPPQLQSLKQKIALSKGDSLIHLKADGAIDIYPWLEAKEKVSIATLTAFAIYWWMQDESSRNKLCKRAKAKLESIIAGREEFQE